MTSPVRMYCHSSSWWPSARERSGVEQTHFAPSKPGAPEVLLQREVEVLRAGLAEDVLPGVAGLGDPGQRLLGRHVHDVERRTGQVGQHDRAVGRLLLGLPGPGDAVEVRRGLAARERLLDEHVDGRAVLGVHHDQAAVAGRGLHGLQDLPVAGQEHAGVGHEQLEAGDALADQLVHRLERLVVDVADDLVEAVVDGAVAAGLLVPERDLVLHPLPVRLHDEVDDRRRAAPGRGPGAGLERVARRRCRRTASPCGCGRRCRRG